MRFDKLFSLGVAIGIVLGLVLLCLCALARS